MRRLSQSGDTIVEVLIAIAVISSVLGGAFVSANRSLNGGRHAQERAEAVKELEAQLEQLKAASSGNEVFSAASYFCLDGLQKRSFSASTPNLDDFSAYPNECRVGTSGRYHVSIQRLADNVTFRARIIWDKAGTAGRDNATIVYRVHP